MYVQRYHSGFFIVHTHSKSTVSIYVNGLLPASQWSAFLDADVVARNDDGENPGKKQMHLPCTLTLMGKLAHPIPPPKKKHEGGH